MISNVADSYPLPEDPLLADVSAALRDSGHWGSVLDDRWNLVYATDEIRRTFGGDQGLASFAIGKHYFGPESQVVSREWRFGANSTPSYRSMLAGVGNFMLADTPGGKDELRDILDPSFRDMVDDFTVSEQASTAFVTTGMSLKGAVDVEMLLIRIRDSDGRLAGSAVISKPAAGMNTISSMVSEADLHHLERMQSVMKAARRPAAILFADLEGSSALSRGLSTAAYFALGRRLVRAADGCIIDAGGLVGRHVGDGVVAFFLTETTGSDSLAARACIEAMRELRAAVDEVSIRSGLNPEEVVLRFGLHWGSTLYVGNISTRGRSEVTALGDEVNEGARIEACATGGRALASKSLLERLDQPDAAALGLDPDNMTYTVLAELPSASEKARRDAPAIAVCEI